MSASPSRILQFEEFTLDVGRGALMRGTSEVRLRRQTFEVLLYLADRAGQVVPSHELVTALWTSAPADANASAGQCIKEIRRALGADGRWIIKTVTGCGYEFKAAVTTEQRLPLEDVLQSEVAFASAPLPTVAGSAKSVRQSLFSRQSLIRYSVMLAAVGAVVGLGGRLWLGSDPPQEALTMMAIPAIAVPPFKIEASDDSAATPGGGSIGELVRSELAQASPGLDLVIKSTIEHQSARSADSNRGVRYLVLGTTWHRQRTQHLNVQLTERESGEQIWARAFSFDRDQIGAEERTAAIVAREIGVAVRHTEARRPLPPAPEAGHFALQGFALLESERGSQVTLPALTLFENALAIDANSLSAKHGLARLKISMAIGGAWMLPRAWRIAMLDQADTAIQSILKHDPRNLAVQALRGSLLRERRQVDDALAAFELVLSKNPNDSFSLAELGRTKIDAGLSREAIAHLEDAIQLSPTDPLIYLRYFWAGMAAVHLSDDATAVKWLIKARQANQFFPHSSMWLAVAYQRLGDDENAKAMMAEFRKAVLSFTIASWKKHFATNNVVVADQRESIETALRRLVPEIASVEAEHSYSRSISCAGFHFC